MLGKNVPNTLRSQFKEHRHILATCSLSHIFFTGCIVLHIAFSHKKHYALICQVPVDKFWVLLELGCYGYTMLYPVHPVENYSDQNQRTLFTTTDPPDPTTFSFNVSAWLSSSSLAKTTKIIRKRKVHQLMQWVDIKLEWQCICPVFSEISLIFQLNQHKMLLSALSRKKRVDPRSKICQPELT